MMTLFSLNRLLGAIFALFHHEFRIFFLFSVSLLAQAGKVFVAIDT